jgi:hypothetical protein
MLPRFIDQFGMGYFVATLVIIIGCGKAETIELEHSVFQLSTEYDIHTIKMMDDNIGYAVGGRQFKFAFIAESMDGWVNHDLQKIGQDVLLDIECTDFDNCTSVGFYSKVVTKRNGKDWSPRFLVEMKRLSGAVQTADHKIIVVGGRSLNTGIIHFLNVEDGQLLSTHDSFRHEFADVAKLDNGRLVVCGYGIIMYSDDNGQEWTISDVQGDFYKALHFVSNTTGYCVGQFGSILKSTNAGHTWTKIRNGNLLLVSDIEFEDVHFVDEEVGYAVGQEGVVWKTVDGGDEWKEITNVPSQDYFCVTGTVNNVFIGGSNGTILKLTN